MEILIIGSGGREHTLAWKIRQSPRCGKLYCAPGNAGIAALAECVTIPIKPPFRELIAWCGEHKIGLAAVGPEDPLAAGVVDALADAGIEAFGPKAAGAHIEASKKFAKELMVAARIPTASATTFTDSAAAIAHLTTLTPPYVIKADGLAAGKGVTVAATEDEAIAAIRAALDEGAFGAAGREVLIEEYLDGVEASLLAFTDGKTILAMDSAQDHKAVFDGDKGPNTGGMGALSPAPVLTPEYKRQAQREILEPLVAEFQRRGIDYRGVVYAGLMITKRGPMVIEFNCRFGDPETQALLPRLENDMVEVMLACIRGTLNQIELRWRTESCVCIVAASGGYPGSYAKGKVVSGLDPAKDQGDPAKSAAVFHAGTGKDSAGNIVTSGGRVLGITALGQTLEEARSLAYARLKEISFEGMHYRTDIGFRANRKI
ncbi:phosphoribosylamine--glycine ligase [Candidatus Sumerlaeota bacterium]|nr:phosphoribosylamine--glycine ligase [Candidatus Sumerlaeota bacterium]